MNLPIRRRSIAGSASSGVILLARKLEVVRDADAVEQLAKGRVILRAVESARGRPRAHRRAEPAGHAVGHRVVLHLGQQIVPIAGPHRTHDQEAPLTLAEAGIDKYLAHRGRRSLKSSIRNHYPSHIGTF